MRYTIIFLVIANTCLQLLAATDSSRLVTLGGPVTEIVYALGHGDAIVATDQSSTYPPEATQLPQVGYIRAISAEGVLAQSPTLILATDDLGPPPAANQLKAGGVELIQTVSPKNQESLFECIKTVGDLLNETDASKALIDSLKGEFETASTIADGKDAPRVVFILSHFGGGRAAGRGTIPDGLLELIKAENVFDDFGGYKEVTEEAILSVEPDFVLIGVMPQNMKAGREELLSKADLAALAKVQGIRVIPLDISYYLSFGPRTGQAAQDLAEHLYGKSAE